MVKLPPCHGSQGSRLEGWFFTSSIGARDGCRYSTYILQYMRSPVPFAPPHRAAPSRTGTGPPEDLNRGR